MAEIELKLQIEDKDQIVGKLLDLGAKLKRKIEQTDILYDSKYFSFEPLDQALRLRIEKSEGKESAELAFKGTPTHTKDGHKIRDEFETEVDPEQMRKILTSVGFAEEEILEKKRENYELGNLDIVIDELEFGTFLELEGEPDDIEDLRKKLGLENAEPVKEGYVALKWKWQGFIPERYRKDKKTE